MTIELNSPKLLLGVAIAATGSVSFTGAFAITMTAQAQRSAQTVATFYPSVVRAIASQRQVFDDRTESVRFSNAQLIEQALADQSRQLRRNRTAPTPHLQRSSHATALASSSVQSVAQRFPLMQWLGTSVAGEFSQTVRILIFERSALRISSDANFAITDDQGQILQNFEGMSAVSVEARAGRLQVDGYSLDRSIWLQPETDDALIFVDDRWYRGLVKLFWEDDNIRVVNYVNLEEYLYSVVGAEMPSSWSFEALKAQAVAARSYALFHMARSGRRSYDLTNTQRHQMYRGVVSETEVSHTAVAETIGLVVVAQNGNVLETMYASTDEVVSTAHRGSLSMSQTGAALKADEGWNFAEILLYYYPSTVVAALL